MAPTIASMAAAIEAATIPERPLVPIRTGGALPPLFCIHGIGGTSISYYHLTQHLSPSRPLYGLQHPGMYEPESEPRSVEALASIYIQEIKSVQSSGPYLIAGWSFGGTIAFEIARQLESNGDQVAFLGLIDAIAPVPRLTSRLRRMLEVTRIVSNGQDLERQILAAGDSLRSQIERIVLRNQEAIRDYYPTGQLGVPTVAVFRAAETLAESEAGYKRIAGLLKVAQFGEDDGYALRTWQSFSRYPVMEYVVEGDHFTILKDPYVRQLGRIIESAIAGRAGAASNAAGRG
jgi:thioesterase domain-containing protein